MSFLEVNHLFFKYDSSKRFILNDINFSMNAGDWITILGHNGSGKSTLLKCIDGLLKPQKGKILFDNSEMNNQNVWNLRKKIGIIFQNPDDQFVRATVAEDVAFSLENNSIDSRTMHEYVKKSLKEVDMLSFYNKSPYQLSGGQKQRVALAGIIAQRPKLIMLDESMSMLDSYSKQKIFNLIYKLHNKYNISVLSVTHNLDEAIYSDIIFVIDKGKIIFKGVPRDIFSNVKKLIKLNLDIPYTEKLKIQLNKYGFELPSYYLNIEEFAAYLWKLFLRT